MENEDFTLGGFSSQRISTRYVARIQVVARIGDLAAAAEIDAVSNPLALHVALPIASMRPRRLHRGKRAGGDDCIHKLISLQ